MLTKTFWLEISAAIIIGRYLPIHAITGGMFVPLIPYEEFTAPGNRLPSSNPLSGVVNPVLDGYCALTLPIDNFYRDTFNRLGGGVGDIYTGTSRAVTDRICPGAPVPDDIPFNSPPLYPASTRCPSSGIASGQTYAFSGGTWIPTDIFSESWGCGDNKGWPTGGIQAYTLPGGSVFLGCPCVRQDGSTYIQVHTAANFLNPNVRQVVTQSVFTECPGCAVTPIRPRVPALPERPVLPDPPEPPNIPINIELPQLPGLPAIQFPAIYIPITPQLTLNAPITLSPRIDISPEFSFAPNIEIGLGGISIEGGGYPEPVPDVIRIITDGSPECPDPCEPLDYDLIRTIAIQELDAKFPPTRPFTNEVTTFAAADSGSIELPEFSQWVQITIVEPPRNVRVQEGNAFAPNIFYNGWYSFGVTNDAGDRKPIQYNVQSIPVPAGAREFSFTIIGLGTASIQVGYLLEA